jgi:hypothetical protein
LYPPRSLDREPAERSARREQVVHDRRDLLREGFGAPAAPPGEGDHDLIALGTGSAADGEPCPGRRRDAPRDVRSEPCGEPPALLASTLARIHGLRHAGAS